MRHIQKYLPWHEQALDLVMKGNTAKQVGEALNKCTQTINRFTASELFKERMEIVKQKKLEVMAGNFVRTGIKLIESREKDLVKVKMDLAFEGATPRIKSENAAWLLERLPAYATKNIPQINISQNNYEPTREDIEDFNGGIRDMDRVVEGLQRGNPFVEGEEDKDESLDVIQDNRPTTDTDTGRGSSGPQEEPK